MPRLGAGLARMHAATMSGSVLGPVPIPTPTLTPGGVGIGTQQQYGLDSRGLMVGTPGTSGMMLQSTGGSLQPPPPQHHVGQHPQ